MEFNVSNHVNDEIFMNMLPPEGLMSDLTDDQLKCVKNFELHNYMRCNCCNDQIIDNPSEVCTRHNNLHFLSPGPGVLYLTLE